jgi:hypothetical protein
VTGRGKKKFSALLDDEANPAEIEDDGQSSRHRRSTSQSSIRKSPKNKSKESLPGSSPKTPMRILKPPSLQGKKVVRALQDFSGSSDELSFKAGDEIVVISEVLDEWWMGELDGRKGLFPTPYTEVIPANTLSSKQYSKSQASSLFSEDVGRKLRSADIYSDGYGTSDLEEDVFRGVQPLPATRSPFYGGPSDLASITSSVAEEEEKQGLVSLKKAHNSQSQLQDQKIPPSAATADVGLSTSTPGKKAPPPPPPRRPTNSISSVGPPIPERRSGTTRTQSSSSGSLPITNIPTPASSNSSNGYDTSPFESAAEILTTGCTNFKQSPFHARGFCGNCLEMHG